MTILKIVLNLWQNISFIQQNCIHYTVRTSRATAFLHFVYSDMQRANKINTKKNELK